MQEWNYDETYWERIFTAHVHLPVRGRGQKGSKLPDCPTLWRETSGSTWLSCFSYMYKSDHDIGILPPPFTIQYLENQGKLEFVWTELALYISVPAYRRGNVLGMNLWWRGVHLGWFIKTQTPVQLMPESFVGSDKMDVTTGSVVDRMRTVAMWLTDK